LPPLFILFPYTTLFRSKGIYFFPTHSPSNMDNIWIAFHHILSIGKIPAHERTKDAQSIVYFKNRQALKLSISFHTLKEQYNRTRSEEHTSELQSRFDLV